MAKKRSSLIEIAAAILLISAFAVPIAGSLYYQYYLFLPSLNLTADVVASQWAFEPNEITVYENDNVRIRVVSADVEHGFAINEYNVNETVSPYEYKIITFKADKVGTFIIRCSVYCGIKHANMIGTLRVLPRS